MDNPSVLSFSGEAATAATAATTAAERGMELETAEVAVRALRGLHRRLSLPAGGEHRGGRGTAKC